MRGGEEACCATKETHLILHRSLRSVIVGFMLSVVIAAVILWGSLGSSLFGLEVPVGELTITFPFFLVIGLVLIIRPVLLMLDSVHEIACHHVRSIQGRCSLRRHFVEIPFEEILGVRASQSILDRILNVGSILVWTASAERPDLTMKGIKDPEHYARVIGGKIDHSIIEERKKRTRE